MCRSALAPPEVSCSGELVGSHRGTASIRPARRLTGFRALQGPKASARAQPSRAQRLTVQAYVSPRNILIVNTNGGGHGTETSFLQDRSGPSIHSMALTLPIAHSEHRLLAQPQAFRTRPQGHLPHWCDAARHAHCESASARQLLIAYNGPIARIGLRHHSRFWHVHASLAAAVGSEYDAKMNKPPFTYLEVRSAFTPVENT